MPQAVGLAPSDAAPPAVLPPAFARRASPSPAPPSPRARLAASASLGRRTSSAGSGSRLVAVTRPHEAAAAGGDGRAPAAGDDIAPPPPPAAADADPGLQLAQLGEPADLPALPVRPGQPPPATAAGAPHRVAWADAATGPTAPVRPRAPPPSCCLAGPPALFAPRSAPVAVGRKAADAVAAARAARDAARARAALAAAESDKAALLDFIQQYEEEQAAVAAGLRAELAAAHARAREARRCEPDARLAADARAARLAAADAEQRAAAAQERAAAAEAALADVDRHVRAEGGRADGGRRPRTPAPARARLDGLVARVQAAESALSAVCEAYDEGRCTACARTAAERGVEAAGVAAKADGGWGVRGGLGGRVAQSPPPGCLTSLLADAEATAGGGTRGGARAGLEAGAEPAVALSAEEAALRQDLISGAEKLMFENEALARRVAVLADENAQLRRGLASVGDWAALSTAPAGAPTTIPPSAHQLSPEQRIGRLLETLGLRSPSGSAGKLGGDPTLWPSAAPASPPRPAPSVADSESLWGGSVTYDVVAGSWSPTPSAPGSPWHPTAESVAADSPAASPSHTPPRPASPSLGSFVRPEVDEADTPDLVAGRSKGAGKVSASSAHRRSTSAARSASRLPDDSWADGVVASADSSC